ncbi:MAG: cupredoxin domain-containing protein [Candidatus Marinimicrobia bacterium]|nr:cupredoxin domain-containing protein [Candidatus Neomarinimicrobiota bacterium]
MSIKTKTLGLSFGFLLFSLTGLFLIGSIGSQGTSSNGNSQIKVITLVAKGMAFRVQDSAEPDRSTQPKVIRESNPPLILTPGEQVKLIIRNEDPGILHDLALEGLELGLSRPLQYGQSDFITFTVPTKGRLEYFCMEHPEMMRGEIIIKE